MSPVLVSLMFGAGIAAWVWSKVAKGSGNADPKKSFGIAGIAGVAAFVFFFTLMKFVLHLS